MISNVAMSYVLYDESRYRYYITFNRRQETSSFDHLQFTTIAMEYYDLLNPIPLSLPSIEPLPLEAYINLDDILSPVPCTNLLEVLTTSRGKPMVVHEDNLFQQRSELKNNISYRCNQYHARNGNCPATITTDKNRSLLLSFNGPHNHPDRSPNSLEKHRKRHRLHVTYSADITKPVRALATELGVTVDNTFRIQHSRIRKRHRKIASETGMLAATEPEAEPEATVNSTH